MSEKAKLCVGFIGDNRTEVWAGEDYLVATVWPNDFFNAGQIVAAVNAYDPNAIPATLEVVSDSQWIPQSRGAINAASISSWSANNYIKAQPCVLISYFNGADDQPVYNRDAELFIRYMARVMGDAFPPALKELRP